MPKFVQWPGSEALLRRLSEYANVAESRRFAEFRGSVRGAVIRGNRDGLLAGTDGRGRKLAGLRPSTLKRRRPGQGTVPFITRGGASRFITTFRADWRKEGGVWVLVCRWVGLVSERGTNFVQYHLTGTRTLPVRNVAGIRPKTWQEIMRLDFAFLDDLTRPRSR